MDTQSTADTSTTIEEVVGHADDTVLPTGETIIYDYDENGQFIGWHKGAQA